MRISIFEKIPFFEDPRFRRERIFLTIFIPAAALGLIAVATLVYLRSVEPPPKPEEIPPLAPYVETPADLVAKATRAFQKRDLAAARTVLAQVSLPDLKSPAAWELDGLLHEREGNATAAFESYSSGIEQCPSSGLHFRRAVLYRNWGNLTESLNEISAADRLYPNDPLYTNELLLTRISLGQADQIRQELNQLVTTGVNADTTGWIFPLAALALLQNQPADAADALAAAKPSFPQADFHTLLSHPAFAPYLSLPEIFPLTIKNSEDEAPK